jgi:hypothetical protein
VIVTSLLVIAGGVALLVLDDKHWTALVIRGIDVLAGDAYEIDGDFHASMHGGASVTVEGLDVNARDGSFSMVAASASVRVDLWALRHLTLFLEDLQLRDGAIRITVADDGRTESAVGEGGGWPLLPVVGEALVERVSVTFENPDAEATLIDVARLALVEDPAVGMTRLAAYGAVDATAFSIAGSLGDIAALMAPPEGGYPVDVTLTSRAIEARLSGAIAKPMSGEGVDLALAVSAPSVDTLVDVWLPEGVSLGALSGSARLQGEVRALAANEIQLSLQADQGLSVDLHGALGNVLAMRGIDLACLVHIDDTALLQRLLPEGFESIERVVATAALRGGDTAFDLDDLAFVATFRSGDTARLDGVAGLALEPQLPPRLRLAVRGEIERGAGVEEPGRFNQFLHALDTMHLAMDVGFAEEFVSLGSVRLELGGQAGALLTLSGGVDKLPLAEDQWFEGLALQAEFETADVARLGDLFDVELPPRGNTHGVALISGSGRHTVVDDLVLDVQLAQAGSLQVTGAAELDFSAANVLGRIDLGLQGHTAELADVLAEFELATPALGAATLTGRVTGRGRRLDLVYLNLGAPALQSSLESSGSLNLGDTANLELASELKITEVATLLRAFSIDVPSSLGGLSGQIAIDGPIGDLSVVDLVLASTDPGPVAVDVSGVIDHWRPGREPALTAVAIDARAAVPSIAELGAAFGFDIPDIGAADAQVVINDLDGSVGAELVTVRIVKEGIEVVRAEGRIDDLFHRSEISWDAGFDVDLSPLLAYATGIDAPGLGRVRADVELSDADGSLGIERVELSSPEDQLVTINGEGVLDDLLGGDEIEVEASIGVAQPTLLGNVLGFDVVGAGPVRIDGRMVGSAIDNTIEAQLSVGRTEATVSGRFRVEDSKPQLSIDAIIQRFFPSDFGTFDVADVDEPATVAAEPTSLFSDRPVDLTGLDLLNLDLNLRVDEVVTSEDGGLDQIDLGVKLSDGELTVAPIRFVYAGGGLSGRFELKRSPEVSVWLNLEGNDIYLGQVLAQIRDVSTLRGVVSIDAELRAQGNSSRALVSSLGGKVGLVVEDGRVPRRLVDLAMVDTFGWTLNATAARGRSQTLTCGISRLDVTQGLITLESLYLDGPGLRVLGGGQINLPEESLDLVFVPKRKRLVWSRADPVRVSGDLKNPRVTAVPARAAMREIGTFALTGPIVFVSVRALGYLFGMVADEDASTSACLLEPVADDSGEVADETRSAASPDPRGDIE